MANTELDALIAERVMGWTAYNEHRDGFWWNRGDDLVGLSSDDWHPTEDISQAMQAVEKMMFTGDQQNDYGFSLTCEPYDGMYWGASLWNFEKPDSLAHADEDTPALAICKAIASAIEGKVMPT